MKEYLKNLILPIGIFSIIITIIRLLFGYGTFLSLSGWAFVIFIVYIVMSTKFIDEQYHNGYKPFGKWEKNLDAGINFLGFGFLKNAIVSYSREVFSFEFEFEAKHNLKDTNRPFQYNVQYKMLATMEINNPKNFQRKSGKTKFEGGKLDLKDNAWLDNIMSEIKSSFRNITYITPYDELVKDINWTTNRVSAFMVKNGYEDTLQPTLDDYGVKLRSLNAEIKLDKETEKIIADIYNTEQLHFSEINIAKTELETAKIKHKIFTNISEITLEMIVKFMDKGLNEAKATELANLTLGNYDNARLISIANSKGEYLDNVVDRAIANFL